MSERDDQGMALLTADVLAADGPAAEVVARYARDPSSLDDTQRAEVEAWLAASPGARDTLRVLQQFEVPPRPAPEARGEGALARIREWLAEPGRWLPATAATAAAAVLIIALLPGGELPSYVRPAGSLPRPVGTIQARGGDAVDLLVLAPDHVGRTTSPHPTLLYSLATLPSDTSVRFELRDVSTDERTARTLAPPSAAGIQPIDLEALGLALEPEHEYEWTVAVGSTTGHGYLRFVPPAAAVQARLASGAPEALPGLYAGYSYWYDAVTSARDDREAIDSLLEQAGRPPLH